MYIFGLMDHTCSVFTKSIYRVIHFKGQLPMSLVTEIVLNFITMALDLIRDCLRTISQAKFSYQACLKSDFHLSSLTRISVK